MTENDRDEVARTNALLKEKLLRHMPGPGKYPTDVEELGLTRREEGNQSENCFYGPSVGIIVQGTKRAVIGSDAYTYGEGQCLVTGVDMPSSFYVVGASPQRPFLAVGLNLDKYLITRLAAEIPPAPDPDSYKGVFVADVDADMLNAFLRLVDLLDKPGQIPVMAPLIIREIHYRLLVGPQGALLRRLNTLGTQSNQIAKAIVWLRSNFREPLSVDSLARQVNMATSTFHRHFKEVTSLSPLQFHKRLRLYEAQRLMLVENRDAAGAGLAVGYESPTQFSREYKRLFGEPPRRNVMGLR